MQRLYPDGQPLRRMSFELRREATARSAARRARPLGRVRAIGSVEIPQEAFLAILKVDS
jgi:hypothetical protein